MRLRARVLSSVLRLLGAALITAVVPTPARATVPNVDFVVLRLDYRTYTVKGGYSFSQPFRKSLLPESFVRVGDVDYHQQGAGDFGYTEIRSRLTGQIVARASTVWAGTGQWELPSSPLAPMALGGTAGDPTTLDRVLLFGSSILRADSAWASARQAQALEALAATGSYEVVVFNHFYTVGMSNPYTAEWIVVAFTRPPAPPDVGITHAQWPYSEIALGIASKGEATVTNFADGSQSLWLQMRIEQLGQTILTSTMPVSGLAADASRVVRMDPYIPDAAGPLTFSFSLVSAPGVPWADTFGDNDALARPIQVVNDAVFRPVASTRRPGPIPLQCEPLDLDGDGDLDMFRYEYQPQILRRNADGTYTDITAQAPALPHWPRLALARDFDGDTHPDLLLVTYDQPLMLLHGDGAGGFTDVTAAAGLSGINGKFSGAVLDLEKDGDPDLIIGSYSQDRVLTNDGHGHFTDVTSSSGLVAPEQTLDVAAGDINGDGYPDVFVTNWGSPSKLFVNDGDGTFTLVSGPWGTQSYGRQVLFLDADGDGRQDILFLDEYPSNSWFYRNLGGLVFGDVSVAWGINQKAFSGAAADVNGDGLPEVVMASVDGYAMLSSNGSTFVDRTSRLVNIDGAYPLGYEGTRIVDLEGDGLLDIYSQSAVYLNSGGSLDDPASVDPTPTPGVVFTYPNPFSPSRRPATIAFGLAAPGPVHVAIWDLRGRRVRTLLDGRAETGRRTVTWDGRDDSGRSLAAGIYFCTVEANGTRSRSRLALVE